MLEVAMQWLEFVLHFWEESF